MKWELQITCPWPEFKIASSDAIRSLYEFASNDSKQKSKIRKPSVSLFFFFLSRTCGIIFLPVLLYSIIDIWHGVTINWAPPTAFHTVAWSFGRSSFLTKWPLPHSFHTLRFRLRHTITTLLARQALLRYQKHNHPFASSIDEMRLTTWQPRFSSDIGRGQSQVR